MSYTMENMLSSGVETAHISESNTLQTIELTKNGLLTNQPVPAMISAAGTTIASQNNVQLSDASRRKDKYDLLEIDWDYKTVTSKPYVISTGSWSSSAASGDSLVDLYLPSDYFYANHILEMCGNTFVSFRGDFHIVITLQGLPTVAGAVIASVDYRSDPGTNSLFDSFMQQHVVIDASDNSSTADLVIPFKFFRNGVDPFDTAFTCRLTVLAPLQNKTSLSYTVSAFLENQEFKFLRPNNPSLMSRARKTQGLFTFTTINNTLSNVQNATLPSNMTGDALDLETTINQPKVGLMDDVGIPTNPTAVMIKFNSLNNSDNPHYIEKVALKSSTLTVSTEDTFNSAIDEMSLDHILKEREHYVETKTITSETSLLTPLLALNLTPAVLSSDIDDASTVTVNMMEYYSTFFKFWRGGLKFRFRFFMTRFQSIKLYFGLFYKSNPPVDFIDWSASHGVIVDIGGDSREVCLEIPYNSETPWLQVPTRNMATIVSTSPSAANTIYDYILGSLVVYNLTVLESETATPIAMTVTMQGADDFEFATYSTSGRVAQVQTQDILMSKRSLRTPDYLTDTIVSVKQLVKKWQLTTESNFTMNRTVCGTISFPDACLFYNPDATTTYTKETDNYHFQSSLNGILEGIAPFFAYRGGIKYRIEMLVDPNHGIGTIEPIVYYINPNCTLLHDVATWHDAVDKVSNALYKWLTPTEVFAAPTPYLLQPINISNEGLYVYEFEIPWQRNIKYISNDRSQYKYGQFGVVLAAFKKLSSSYEPRPATVRIYRKIADDGRFGILNYGSSTLGAGEGWVRTL